MPGTQTPIVWVPGNIGSFIASIPSRIFGGGETDGDDGRSTFSGRDLIALLATLGIDFGLFALMVLNPPAQQPVRAALTKTRLTLPPETVIRHIRDAVQTAIARAPGADFEWVRKHFLHHRQSAYFVIPNLYGGQASDEKAPDRDEMARALAMNQLAGVLTDLDLVRWPKPEEIKKLREEEKMTSDTDLTQIRKEWLEGQQITDERAEKHGSQQPIRNHGLFSKAEAALRLAG